MGWTAFLLLFRRYAGWGRWGMSCGCRPQHDCGRPNKIDRRRQTTDDAQCCNLQDDRRRANDETAAKERDIEERVKDIEALADKARHEASFCLMSNTFFFFVAWLFGPGMSESPRIFPPFPHSTLREKLRRTYAPYFTDTAQGRRRRARLGEAAKQSSRGHRRTGATRQV